MLDTVYCEPQLQTLEALVRLDILKSFFQRGLGCVARKGFEHRIGIRFADFGYDRLEGLRASSKKGYCEVALRRLRENPRDSCSLCVIGELHALEDVGEH